MTFQSKGTSFYEGGAHFLSCCLTIPKPLLRGTHFLAKATMKSTVQLTRISKWLLCLPSSSNAVGLNTRLSATPPKLYIYMCVFCILHGDYFLIDSSDRLCHDYTVDLIHCPKLYQWKQKKKVKLEGKTDSNKMVFFKFLLSLFNFSTK